MLYTGGAGKGPSSATAQPDPHTPLDHTHLTRLLPLPNPTTPMPRPSSAQSHHDPLSLGPLLPFLQGTLALDRLGMEHQRRGDAGQVTQDFPEGATSKESTGHNVPRPCSSPVGISLPGQGCSRGLVLWAPCRLPPGEPSTLLILPEERELGLRSTSIPSTGLLAASMAHIWRRKPTCGTLWADSGTHLIISVHRTAS